MPASRDGRQIVDVADELEFGQPLEEAECEGGAANAPARECYAASIFYLDDGDPGRLASLREKRGF
jgi:hypothetical protein